ncbi:MAG: hypothetical protein US60_C0047G0011 [Microgenomates group bacterium GW2011_GWC1_37_8]|uniref:LytR/CpsA/Psr regulator C-terminal domain-containing protein n=1 Tax=Candidatus Woesebacteria bacterium GW2011_GWB1_38_8 TaxID=1618570 RepID=A0A0G0L4H3_9BACT|nr:MAG: hypothetical protein US60_C0047G0011 [Microgenomates group bacterium GW2011_GWC1_37_8]KKQ85922.1 MAG: hypothetical protein UT08_C0003G0085 [Candidatus Woesebacteria bacterium GW2011_GWB1_38_8]
MSARRRKNIRNISIGGRKKKIFMYLSFSLFLLLFFLYFKNSTKYWNGEEKVSVVINADSEINVVTFDPRTKEIINIIIPGDTQVDVAESKGIYNLKNVWELGKQQGSGGNLVARTVTKNFKFPVYIWAGRYAKGFISGELFSALKVLFLPYETNLTFGDKLGLTIFSMKVKNPKRVDILLSDTNLLEKATLEDGSEGYIIKGNTSQKIMSVFTNLAMSENIYRIMITDRTGDVGFSESVSEILNVLGGKVVAINKEVRHAGVCEIKGKDENILELITKLLPCTISKEGKSNFDLEVVLNEDFEKRF